MEDKLSDEKIVFFVQHTRQLLDYIEHGIPPEAPEGVEGLDGIDQA